MQNSFSPKVNRNFMQKRDSKTNLRDARLAGKLENSKEEITTLAAETEDLERAIAVIGNDCNRVEK